GITCAPGTVLVVHVEGIFRRRLSPEHMAASSVKDSFRLCGRTAGVENEKWMLGVDCHGFAAGIDVGQLAVPPNVPAFFHVDLIARSPENDDPFDRGAPAESMINVVFEGNNRAAAIAAVGRNQ